MPSERAFVVDTSVLSAADAAGWFDGLEHWTGEVRLLTPTAVWRTEFLESHEVERAPAWLAVEGVELDDVAVHAGGQLSLHDWRCIVLAEAADGAIVSNDSALLERFADRGGRPIWGTKFLKRTFERCGISEDAFEAGVETYISDAYLPDSVGAAFRNAEKDG
jgi:hypothetical protein